MSFMWLGTFQILFVSCLVASGICMVGHFPAFLHHQYFQKKNPKNILDSSIPQICGSTQGIITFGVVPVFDAASFPLGRQRMGTAVKTRRFSFVNSVIVQLLNGFEQVMPESVKRRSPSSWRLPGRSGTIPSSTSSTSCSC